MESISLGVMEFGSGFGSTIQTPLNSMLILFLRNHYPIHVLFYCDSLGHAGLGAICISQNGGWQSIYKFISVVKQEIEKNEQEKWNPVVCIDKDASGQEHL